jgi:hypothetical protein
VILAAAREIDAKRGDHFLQAELPGTYPHDAQLDYFRIADDTSGIVPGTNATS